MLVAVYGTLRLDQGNYKYLLEGTAAEHRGVDFIEGTMFSLGGFPGVITGDNHKGLVEVDLFYLPEPSRAELLRSLDGLEGYSPDRSPERCMYLRKTTTTKGGHMVFYYEWNRDVPNDNQLIPSGNWLDHIENRYQIKVRQ